MRVDKLQLLPTDVFYRRAMKRSAEIKARVLPQSAAEIMSEAGVPNMLEGRELRLNVLGGIAGDDSGRETSE